MAHKKADITGINPKDAIAHRKVAVGLFPAAGTIYGALAMGDGLKYGPYNWRDKAVHLTIYLDAIERHLFAIRDGEWLDEESGVPHFGHIIASSAIILDANGIGKLVNDLPLPGPASTILKAYTKEE